MNVSLKIFNRGCLLFNLLLYFDSLLVFTILFRPYKIFHLSSRTLQYPLQFPLMFYDFVANKVTPVDMAAAGFDANKEFKPHGISLLKQHQGGGDDRMGLLAVVNHAVIDGESRVELFSVHDGDHGGRGRPRDHDSNGGGEAVPLIARDTLKGLRVRHLGSVGSFGAGTLNDVVLIDADTLYVTEWYKHSLPQDGSTAPLAYKIMQNVFHTLGLPIYTLHKCVRGSGQWMCAPALTLPSMNGISTTAKRDILAVVQISTKSVHFYRVGGELEHLTSLALPIIVDNLSLDSTNNNPDLDIWYGAGILRGLDFLVHTSKITNDTSVDSIPSGEIRVTYNRKTSHASVELLRTARDAGCWCNSIKIPTSADYSYDEHDMDDNTKPTTIIGSFCRSGVYICH